MINKRFVLIFNSFLLLLCNDSYCWAWPVYDPWDVVQNTITAKNSATALINQAKQLENDMRNLKSLMPFHEKGTAKFLDELGKKNQIGQALSYSSNNPESSFQKQFPGLMVGSDAYSQFSNVSNTVRDTLRGTFVNLAQHGQSLAKESNDITNLEDLSNNSSGNLQALQTSHRISLQEVTQLQKIRQLMLSQASSVESFLAYQVQRDQTAQKTIHEVVLKSQSPFQKYDDRKGFGYNNLPQLP